MSSHSGCRIGANACGRSQRASRKLSANRSSIRTQRLASALMRRISAVPLQVRLNHRCSQLLARPRSRGRTQRGNGVRLRSKHAQSIRSRAQCAASRCLSVGVDIAMRACRKRGASMDCERSKRLAKRWQRKLTRERSTAQRRREPRARRSDQRRASPQSQLGARASGPARRGVVQARDRAEARCVLAQGDRQGDGPLARGLLAHPRRRAVPHPRHWDGLLALVEA